MSMLAESIRQNLENITPIEPREITEVRHKAEQPLFRLCVLIFIVAVITVFTSDIGDLGVLFILPSIIIFALYYNYAKARASAIRVTERNFPEIYYKSIEFAKKLGMEKVPPVFIEQKNGMLNAFAATIFGRRYAKLNAELVDVAYMEHKDFDTVFFVLAHEFGHHYFRHADFSRILLISLGHLIPVFGTMHSRSMEYSCDRVAQLLLGRNGVNELMLLSAGRHLYKYVDAEDYLRETKKGNEFLPWFVNLFATHPIMPKRIAALADPERKSGKLF